MIEAPSSHSKRMCEFSHMCLHMAFIVMASNGHDSRLEILSKVCKALNLNAKIALFR